MSYRRYPDRERALSQLDRRHSAPPPSELQQRLAVQARAALDNAGRELTPLAEALHRVAASAPALLAQTAPAASKFIEALKQPARTA
ncbi:hypothetical protein ACF09J_13850 [Streptomyces sp. NPDC014889]|uniref:hypothetical protein n=1 Tax=Streptomyces sp. NPDC014889 TaxID=3364928 RepID=UPI0036F992C8